MENRRKKARAQARAWIELDAAALRHNVQELQGLLPAGAHLMPVVKADAYGHGAALVAKELNRMGIRSFCVATATEGAALRACGIRGEILVLGYTEPEQFPLLQRCRLTQTLTDSGYAYLLDAYGRKRNLRLPVQIKIDTGMHRLGQRPEELEQIHSVWQRRHLAVTGVYTHLCEDEAATQAGRAMTSRQADAFFSLIAALERSGCPCGTRHLLASEGLLRYASLGGDCARVGIALYGVLASRSCLSDCPVQLQPVLSLKARVAQTRFVPQGEGVGYGQLDCADHDRRIATLTIGYADGVDRLLSCGRGHVLLHACAAPVVGLICMDQMMVDITRIPEVRAGDTAVLIGRSGDCEITAYDLAEATGTITNEVLSRLGARLTRRMLY